MNVNVQQCARWTVRIAASLVFLNGLFWTWFALACAWPDPLGMAMHILIPGLPMVLFGILCWRLPAFGGFFLTLWGASPLLILIGSRPFFNYAGQWLSLTPLLVYGVPLVAGVLLIIAGIVLDRKQPEEK